MKRLPPVLPGRPYDLAAATVATDLESGGVGAAVRHSNPPFSPQLWCERVNPENKAALEAWVRETGIRLVQVNGQRKYGGPPPGKVFPAVCLVGG